MSPKGRYTSQITKKQVTKMSKRSFPFASSAAAAQLPKKLAVQNLHCSLKDMRQVMNKPGNKMKLHKLCMELAPLSPMFIVLAQKFTDEEEEEDLVTLEELEQTVDVFVGFITSNKAVLTFFVNFMRQVVEDPLTVVDSVQDLMNKAIEVVGGGDELDKLLALLKSNPPPPAVNDSE